MNRTDRKDYMDYDTRQRKESVVSRLDAGLRRCVALTVRAADEGTAAKAAITAVMVTALASWSAPALAQSASGEQASERAPSQADSASAASQSVRRAASSTLPRAQVSQGSTGAVSPGASPQAPGQVSITPWGWFGGKGEPETDTSYDFGTTRQTGSATERGAEGASFTLGSMSTGAVPQYHLVRKGDTLWDLCAYYYGDPYAWPRVWSYNPQVTNPHWIYPGDRLRMGGPGSRATGAGHGAVSGLSRSLDQGEILSRDAAFVGDATVDAWGQVTGSTGDTMLLAEGDTVYVQLAENRRPVIGQQLTIFQQTRLPEAGKDQASVVAIKGSAKVVRWNPKTRMAHAKVIESTDVIERGDKVGAIRRDTRVIRTVPNRVDLWATMTGALHPRELVGQYQLVFIDKGAKDGLVPGNRLFAVGAGDRWEKSLDGAGVMAASQVDYELKSARIRPTPRGAQQFPTQVVGEVTVVSVKQTTATCLVTRSYIELEPGQALLARRGY